MNNNQPNQLDTYREYMLSHPQQAKRISSYLNKGRHLMEVGAVNEARRHFLQALNVYHHVVPALNNLALIALEDEDTTRALDIAKEVLEYDNQDPLAYAIIAKCWLHLESLPMANFYANQSMVNLLELFARGDKVDPEYPNYCLQILFGVLVLLEDDIMVFTLHTGLVDYPWDPYELTWIGIAYFNRGLLHDAFTCWVKAEENDFLPATTYLSLLDVIKQQKLPPFHLDYNLNLFDEDFNPPGPFFSLIIAHLIDLVFNSEGEHAQNALSCLAESNMPGLNIFLHNLFISDSLSIGLKITAALHLFWEGELSNAELKDFYDEIPEQEVTRADLPAYYLLGAIVIEGNDAEVISTQYELAGLGLLAAEGFKECWAIEYLKEYHEPQELLNSRNEQQSIDTLQVDKTIPFKPVNRGNWPKHSPKK